MDTTSLTASLPSRSTWSRRVWLLVALGLLFLRLPSILHPFNPLLADHIDHRYRRVFDARDGIVYERFDGRR